MFAIFAAGALVSGTRPMNRKAPALLAASVFIIIAVGLRREVGGDWYNYLFTFQLIRQEDLPRALQQTEPAYALLNWIAGKAGWGIWFPNLICAIFFTLGLISLCKLQPNATLGLAVAVPYFIIGVGMGYTRQSAAVGFVMLALASYQRGQTGRMFVFIALASLFHSSSLIVVPMFALAIVERGIFTLGLLAVLAAGLYVEFSSHFAQKFALYTTREYGSTGAIPRLGMNFLPALLFLSFRHRFSRNPAELKLWTVFSLAAIGAMSLLIFIDATVLVDRLGIYLIPIQIFVLSRIPAAFGKGSRQNMMLLVFVLVYSFAVEMVWLNLGSWSHAWIPYNNYLIDQSPTRIHAPGSRR